MFTHIIRPTPCMKVLLMALVLWAQSSTAALMWCCPDAESPDAAAGAATHGHDMHAMHDLESPHDMPPMHGGHNADGHEAGGHEARGTDAVHVHAPLAGAAESTAMADCDHDCTVCANGSVSVAQSLPAGAPATVAQAMAASLSSWPDTNISPLFRPPISA